MTYNVLALRQKYKARQSISAHVDLITSSPHTVLANNSTGANAHKHTSRNGSHLMASALCAVQMGGILAHKRFYSA